MTTRTGTIAICDLNAAVAAKSDTRKHSEKCLMAQFAARITGKRISGSTSNAAHVEGDTGYAFRVAGAEHLVNYFDSDEIYKVRTQLPFNVMISY